MVLPQMKEPLYDDDGDPQEFDEEGFVQIFAILDTDNSGSISQDEMFSYLRNICGVQISL